MSSNIIGCNSNIKIYNGIPSIVTITSDDYSKDCVKFVGPFPITIERENEQRFNIDMNFPNGSNYFIVVENIDNILRPAGSGNDGSTIEFPPFLWAPYTTTISSCTTNCGEFCNGKYIKDNLVVKLTLGNINGLDSNLYNVGDIYYLYLYTCDINGNRGAAVDFVANYAGLPIDNNIVSNIMTNSTTTNNIMSLQSNNLKCTSGKCHKVPKDICNKVRIPTIDILGQSSSLSKGEDMGEVIFTIKDEFTYYDKEHISYKGQCKIRYIEMDKIRITRFKRCPELVSVLRGTGDTLLVKAKSLYNKLQTPLTFIKFYENILYYAMAKYILSRVLYGKFDVNFLLGKYNKKFLEDLGGSRFCGFITIFEDCQSEIYGYKQFFKSDKVGS